MIDGNGNPVQGASVSVTNTTINPNVNVSDSSDANGIAIFYNLPPDTASFDYVVNATKSGFSSLTTIAPSGSLQPTYSHQKVFSQSSSYLTLVIKPQGSDSLMLEAVSTTGTAIANLRTNIKGGYKRFTSPTNTEYYFNNSTPSDTRPTTDVNGLAAVSNLVPGPYYICGDQGATGCTVGGTTYYLVAAIPYSGSTAYSPITVPTYSSANPPSPTYTFNSVDYYQKARLILSTSSTFPRITSLSINEVSLSGSSLTNITFEVTGANLPCNSVAASCLTSVTINQGAQNYIASCTGSAAGLNLSCTVNLTGINAGSTRLVVSANGNTYTSPADLVLGGFNVVP